MNYRAVCIILILIVSSARAAESLICRSVVSRLEFSSVETAEFAKPLAAESTVKHLQSVKENPDFAILKLVGSQWRSKWSPDGQNIQSDPRNLLILLGDTAAEKLGFKWIDKKTLQVPKGKYFSARLLKLNSYLKRRGTEPLDISFYDTSAQDPLGALDFLSKALTNRLPVAESGHFLIHDVAAHYGSILLPRAITRQLVMKVHLAQKFTREMEAVLNKLSPEVAANIRELNQRWLQLVAQRVDGVTGNFTLRYVDLVLKGNNQKQKVEFLEESYLKNVRNETPEELIKRWANFLFMNIEHFRFETQNFDQQIDLFYDFTSAFRKSLPQGAREPLAMSASDLIAFVEKRRLDISLWDGN
ncbi:MAG: hypothetical protein ACK5V3_04530 [Bdellovibrionales bacterium]